MENQPKRYNRFIIIGDAGRGKSVLALKLSKRLHIKHYSTDDFYWKKKFTQPENKQVSTGKISKIYKTKEWIVEGTTCWLLDLGLDSADIIIYLKYKNIVFQWLSLFKRYLTEKDASLKETLSLMKHVFYKRYKLGYKKGKMTHQEAISLHRNKVIELHSFREIDDFVDSL